MSQFLLMSVVCVAVFAADCSAQMPSPPTVGKPDEDNLVKDQVKAKSLDDLTHKYVAQIDELLKHKEAELLEV